METDGKHPSQRASLMTTRDVVERVKVAAALKGLTLGEYVRDALLGAAYDDIEEFRREPGVLGSKARKRP